MSAPESLTLADGRVVPLRNPPVWRAVPILRDYAVRESYGARGLLHFAMLACAWEAGREEVRKCASVASDPKERAAFQREHSALAPPWRPLSEFRHDLVAWGEHVAESLAGEDFLALDRLGDALIGDAFRRIYPRPAAVEEQRDFSVRTSGEPSDSSPAPGSGSSETPDGS